MPTPSSAGPRPQGDGIGRCDRQQPQPMTCGSEPRPRGGTGRAKRGCPFPSFPPEVPPSPARSPRGSAQVRVGGSKRRRRKNRRRRKKKKRRRKRQRAAAGELPGGGSAHGLGSTRWSRAHPHAAAPRTLPAGCCSWAALRSRRQRQGQVLG